MSPERWRRIEHLYHAALDMEQSQRAAFLAQAADADEELRREVESLLAQNTSDQNLLDCNVWQNAEANDMAAFDGCSAEPKPATAEPGSDVETRFTPGTILAGRYRIVAPLGCGGMGEVYRATDLVLGQMVALKFLPESFANDPFALNRLYNEVRLARQISHPNVCRVYDLAEDAGLRFLTMEYIDGETLSSLLRRIGRVPSEKAIEIAHRLCAGVAAAHERGVLHRDLKPANIMIDAQGNVRITDFGLAVLAARSQTHDIQSGTPPYMAPEQLTGSAVTVRSDIYSLGLVLCELFGGKHPFKDHSTAELFWRKLQTRAADLPLDLRTEPEIEQAIRHCLETDPRNRPLSAAALTVELCGGDALAATIGRGETPTPELVAHAGPTAGLSVRVAVACFSTAILTLSVFPMLSSRTSFLSAVRVESSDALKRVARDTLSTLGLEGASKHTVARFSYDIHAFRQGFNAAAVYFWYRTSPRWMVPHDVTGVITAGNPPTDLPGMITTKWDGTGRLLYLKAVPSGAGASSLRPSDLWARLFNAAGLQSELFHRTESRWIPAPGWDEQASWTGTYPDTERTPVRVEGASWKGRPVYFEVSPIRWDGGGVAPRFGHRRSHVQLGALILLSAASTLLAWRNVRLGRGDRRGAFRIAMFVFVVAFAVWVCEASHVPELAEFTVAVTALLWAGFLAFSFWTLYLAFEPYVRRRWPHVIVSWTRVLSGRIRDPAAGSHTLIGLTFGTVAAVAIMVYASVFGSYGPLPSYWMLSGTWGVFGHAINRIINALIQAFIVLFLAYGGRVFCRSEWLAVPAIAALGFVFAASTMQAVPTGFLYLLLAVAYMYLLLRCGLLSVAVASYANALMISLPLTTDFSAPATQASLLLLCGLAALAWFGFHSALAGRRLFQLDF